MEATWGLFGRVDKLKSQLMDTIDFSNKWITELDNESTHSTDDLAFLGDKYKNITDSVLELQSEFDTLEYIVSSLERKLKNASDKFRELEVHVDAGGNYTSFPRSEHESFRDFEGGINDVDSGFLSPRGSESEGSSGDSFLPEFRESPYREFPAPDTVVNSVEDLFSRQGWRASVEHSVKGSDILGMLNVGAHGKQRESLRVAMNIENPTTNNYHYSLRLMFLDNMFGPGSYAELYKVPSSGSAQMWRVSDVLEDGEILESFVSWLQASTG